MYVLKNALKSINRLKGRNILIGVIVLVIALSSCIGLSIRQAAESAKEETLASMTVTATISFDRSSAMSQMGEENGSFDKSSFRDMMNDSSSLSLEEYETYAQAQSVESFYYSSTAYVNGTDDFEPVSTQEEQTDEETDETENQSAVSDENIPQQADQGGQMMGGKGDRIFGSNSDFTVVGYSSEDAMTSFINGTSSVSDGTVFDMGNANYQCIISSDLATYNGLSTGDTIKISNPNNEDETYELEIVGIYTDESSNENSFSMFGSTSSDPANNIYVNYETLDDIVNTSLSVEEDDETSAISQTLSATYCFATVDDYNAFEEEARELGLDDSYVINSSDVSSFENSMLPLETLSQMAGYFLIVILAIGAIILVVLNIFNIRERKYEIGVLTAMGMKKSKVALQFITEIFVVTLIAVVIGSGIGAVSSVPVTNALLENQVASQTSQQEQVEENFGRGGMAPDDNNMQEGGAAPDSENPKDEKGGMFNNIMGINNENAYVTEVSSAMNLTVLLQMMGICILLTVISGAVSMLFVMRYEPLKILANRD